MEYTEKELEEMEKQEQLEGYENNFNVGCFIRSLKVNPTRSFKGVELKYDKPFDVKKHSKIKNDYNVSNFKFKEKMNLIGFDFMIGEENNIIDGLEFTNITFNSCDFIGICFFDCVFTKCAFHFCTFSEESVFHKCTFNETSVVNAPYCEAKYVGNKPDDECTASFIKSKKARDAARSL